VPTALVAAFKGSDIMNRRNTLTLTAMALLCFAVALPADDAAAQQKSLKDQLVGIWTIVSLEVTPPDLPFFKYLSANPKGIMMIDAGGRYAWMAGRPDRPKFEGGGAPIRARTPDAEWGAASKAFDADFGTWSVNEADKIITWKREMSLIPNDVGTEGKESIISLAGDELKTVSTTPGGAKIAWVYRRAK
jgi:hypothetical protein